MQQYTQEQIREIAELPFTALKFKTYVDSLLDFYSWVRFQWTTSAQRELKQKHDLDLRIKADRLKFALLAAKELATDCLPPSQSTANPSPPLGEVQTTKILCQAIALLPYTPTNGLENAPAYRVLGSPISADSLVENYKLLAKKWHPDINPNPEARDRFNFISEIYRTLKGNWFNRYSPLIGKEKFVDALGVPNFDTIYKAAYGVQLRFDPESFW